MDTERTDFDTPRAMGYNPAVASSTFKVLILDRELDRIREYVSNVPHRATGGILAGIYLSRSGVDHLIILHAGTEIPDERLPDENCVDHPVLVMEDFFSGHPQVPTGLDIIGRWHAHLDGLNRPSSNDLEWAMSLLDDPSSQLEVLVHPIVVPSVHEVRIYPYIATRSSLTFQKLNWQVASWSEIDDLQHNRPAGGAAQVPAAGTQLFSVVKARDKFRREAEAVETVPHVVKVDVTDDGSQVTMAVEMRRSDDDIHCWLRGDSLYPVHAPAMRVEINGRTLDFRPASLREWNSMHQLADVIRELNAHLSRVEQQEALPVPDIHESDPVKREAALLKAAGYDVRVSEIPRAGTLLTARSPLLDQAGRIFHAILPPSYPNGSPLWALAPADVPVPDVEFETLGEVSEGFTLLTLLEKLYPAARARRAEAEMARSRTGSPWAALAYLLLFAVSVVLGLAWQVMGEKSPQSLWDQAVALVRGPVPTPEAPASPEVSASPAKPAVPVSRKAPVFVLLIDGGQVTNLTTEQAQALVSTGLGGAPARALTVDLKNPAQDAEAVRKELERAQVFVLFPYRASEKQVQLIKLLKDTGRPLLVLSVAPGDQEKVAREAATLYQELDLRDVRGSAQRALEAWKTRGALVIQ